MDNVVKLAEVGAQINRVGNAIGIFDGTSRILIEEWQKLVPMLNDALNNFVILSGKVEELEKRVEALTPKAPETPKEEKKA